MDKFKILKLICNIEIKRKGTNKITSFDYLNGMEIKTSCKNLTDTTTVKVSRKDASLLVFASLQGTKKTRIAYFPLSKINLHNPKIISTLAPDFELKWTLINN
jgi:hypothetical protein